MRLKNLKKMSFMLSVAIVLNGLVFPVTSSAKDAEKGDIVFADAKLKEVDLSSTFITTFNIADSIENANKSILSVFMKIVFLLLNMFSYLIPLA